MISRLHSHCYKFCWISGALRNSTAKMGNGATAHVGSAESHVPEQKLSHSVALCEALDRICWMGPGTNQQTWGCAIFHWAKIDRNALFALSRAMLIASLRYHIVCISANHPGSSISFTRLTRHQATLEQYRIAMPDKDASTPRVFLARHGETEWSVSGRYTGVTDIPLTLTGEEQVRATGRTLIGPGKLLPPDKLAHVFISPLSRAQKTFSLLFCEAEEDMKRLEDEGKVTTTNRLREWDYGTYEGLLTKEIRQRRKDRGLDREQEWDIWRDGCEDGEYVHSVRLRHDG